MKIDSSYIQMSSRSTQIKSVSVSEQFVVTAGKPDELVATNSGLVTTNSANQNNRAAILLLSPDAQSQSQNQQGQGQAQSSNSNDLAKLKELGGPDGPEVPDKYKMRVMMIRQMVEAITGKKFNMDDINGADKPQPQRPMPSLQIMEPIKVQFQRTETYYESNMMSFQAGGVVNTSDGRQIQFDLNVFASHEFMSSESTAIAFPQKLADPLIINFDGALPEFTKDRYAFDLILGNDLENIFMPTNGSGFLALDKDENGKIDDGSELFGAQTGNGFSELAAYDKDGNMWIDENDDIFSKLKIMFVDKDSGEMMLISLKDSGVGAIYLGSSSTNHEIKDLANDTIGVVRRNGIFLNENGTVGSIHHIDLTY
jgi:hypothetical protein